MRFAVKGLHGRQGVKLVTLEAPNLGAAHEQARAQGLTVLSVAPARSISALAARWSGRFPLLQFTHELIALMEAGLSLPESLEVMSEKETRAEVRAVIEGIRLPLLEGRSLSQSLADRPETFSSLYVATVRASERTGDMSEALRRFIDYQERLDLVRKTVVSASIYPLALMAVGGLVVFFLLGYVVPRFSSIYAESGRELPFLSQMLLDWGNFINAHAGAAALGLLVVVAAGIVFVTRLWSLVRRALVSVPAVGSRVLMYHLARLYRTLSMLQRGGTSIVPALGMVTGLLPDRMRGQLDIAERRIREGASISTAMGEARLTTPIATRMLRVGERSGNMAEMMDRIASFHDEELARWLQWFTKLFEPLLMALIGIVIGGIVVLMYMPIFELAGSLD